MEPPAPAGSEKTEPDGQPGAPLLLDLRAPGLIRGCAKMPLLPHGRSVFPLPHTPAGHRTHSQWHFCTSGAHRGPSKSWKYSGEIHSIRLAREDFGLIGLQTEGAESSAVMFLKRWRNYQNNLTLNLKKNWERRKRKQWVYYGFSCGASHAQHWKELDWTKTIRWLLIPGGALGCEAGPWVNSSGMFKRWRSHKWENQEPCRPGAGR